MQLSLSPLNPHLYRKFPTASPPSGSFLYLTRVGHGVRLAGNLGLYSWECLIDFQGQFLGDEGENLTTGPKPWP